GMLSRYSCGSIANFSLSVSVHRERKKVETTTTENRKRWSMFPLERIAKHD
ncbi:MAG: hypothetical protein ACJARF_002348, partial [Alteromonadaceae bacterium]